MDHKYKSFKEFYSFYLSEHKNHTNRLMHFIGTTLVLVTFVMTVLSQKWSALWLLPLFGYSFAWIGHFFFEHNRPATFKHPLYSFVGDWVMYYELLVGKLKF